MGIYDGMGESNMGGSKYPTLDEGKYVVEIDQVVYLKTRAGYPATIAEYTVVESSNPSHPAGVKRAYFQKMNVDAAMGALKEFSCALAGIDPKDAARVKEESKNLEKFLEAAIGKDNPCKGLRVGVNVTQVALKTQPVPVPGQPAPPVKKFPRHGWTPAPQAA